MNKKRLLPVMLTGLFALGLAFVSCGGGAGGDDPAGNLFTLTNISDAQLAEGGAGGAGFAYVGLYPDTATKANVLADVAALQADTTTSYIIAGRRITGTAKTLSGYFYSADSGFNSVWHGAGTYHIWIGLYDGTSTTTVYRTNTPLTLTDYGSVSLDAQTDSTKQ
ncbi:MAG: hypothetical protein LBO80_03705 [Treponema sp.]|jgi:hypothetical protein|nr:hypothetical protein [Treponema sp.]